MNINAISIVIPVYNEQDNIEAMYQEIQQALDKLITFEVIFVDDGSDDDSNQILEKLAKDDAKLQQLQHKKNYGQSAGIATGVRAAQYPWIVTLDGDRQNDPADIVRLLSIADNVHPNHKAIIVGNRKKRDDNWLRKLSSRIGNGVRQFFLKDCCPDTGCSLKLFPRDEYLGLPQFNHMHRFIPALFKREGYSIINVPVNHRAREHGISKYGVGNRLFVGITDLFGVVWLKNRPCKAELKHD